MQTLQLGHSPDADDAFMFYALAKGLVQTNGLRFKHILKDIQTLNEWALEGRLEITAISFYAYTKVFERYAILSSGASVGDGYGPMIVAKNPMAVNDLRGKTIAVPGTMTTAFLTANLALGKIKYVVMPFNQILEAVADGKVEAGLIIHEGQLTYSQHKLHCVIDLGKWWQKQTGLPLPLGCNIVRRDLGDKTMRTIAKILKSSIEYGLSHRSQALKYALEFTPHLQIPTGDKFISMYVNDYTLDLGAKGKQAVLELLSRSAQAGLSDWQIERQVDFID